MAPPITWRNIDAPNLADALRPLMGAQQSFGGALDTLSRALQNQEATDTANWKQQKDNNTQDFLNQLYARYKTPEALAAARASGEIDQLAGSYGAQVDQAQIRGAADTRLNTLYQQTQQANAYSDQQQELRLRPLLQQAQSLAANGDRAGLDKFLASNPELVSRYGGSLTKEGVTGERDATRFAQSNLKFADDLMSSAVQRQTSLGQLGVAQGNLKIRQDEMRLQARERAETRLADLSNKLVSLEPGINSKSGSEYVLNGLKNAGLDKETTSELVDAFGKMALDPKLRNATPEAVLQTLLEDSNSWLLDAGKSWVSNTSANNLKSLMDTDSYKAGAAARQVQAQVLRDQIDNLKTQLYGPSTAAPAPSPSPAPSPAPVPAPVSPPAAAAAALALPAPTPRPGWSGADRMNRARAVLPWEKPEGSWGTPEAEKKSPAVAATDLKGNVVGTAPALPATPLNDKPAAVSSSTSIAINAGKTGTVISDAPPVTIEPGTKFSKPETAVVAKDSAKIKNTGEKVRMTFVQDGDTASGKRADGSALNCRIETIDAPETAHSKANKPGQPYGNQATKALQDMILNKEVNVRVTRAEDKYGRSICQIEVEGKDVGVEMARGGAAWVYDRFGLGKDPAVSASMEDARKNKRGLWADPNAENPRDFKRRIQ